MHHHPTADVSVRPALPEDAERFGEIQVEAWRTAHSGRIPPAILDGLNPGDFTRAWRDAISRPPSPKHRVLTACAGPAVVGFAALAPGLEEDPTGEIIELAVAADQAQGHADRLLAACTDILTSTGAAQARIWVVDGDEDRERFLTEAGFGPIGVRRVLQVGGTDVVELAWATQLQG